MHGWHRAPRWPSWRARQERRVAGRHSEQWPGSPAPPPPIHHHPPSTPQPLPTPLDSPQLPRPAPAGVLDVEPACRGFLDLAKEGVAACVAAVFADPAFADLFLRLYCRWVKCVGG